MTKAKIYFTEGDPEEIDSLDAEEINAGIVTSNVGIFTTLTVESLTVLDSPEVGLFTTLTGDTLNTTELNANSGIITSFNADEATVGIMTATNLMVGVANSILPQESLQMTFHYQSETPTGGIMVVYLRGIDNKLRRGFIGFSTVPE